MKSEGSLTLIIIFSFAYVKVELDVIKSNAIVDCLVTYAGSGNVVIFTPVGLIKAGGEKTTLPKYLLHSRLTLFFLRQT